MPVGPSNEYVFSTAIHGIRRRSAASASRARVCAFSLRSICWRAASQACGGTIGGRLIPCPGPWSFSGDRVMVCASSLHEPRVSVRWEPAHGSSLVMG